MISALDFKAVIFDLDGLVLDSETGYFTAWKQAAAEMGYQLGPSFCQSLSGLHGPVINQRLLDYCGADFKLDVFAALSTQIWLEQGQRYGIPVKCGFHKLLNCLQELRIPFGLATNSRRADAERCLDWAGLSGVFPLMVCRDEVDRPKPAADLFIKAATLLGQANEDCLVLEDSPTGVAAALAAGSPCIFVPSCLPADEAASSQANRVMQDLAQVADFISDGFDHPL